jgi:hypothetical protein
MCLKYKLCLLLTLLTFPLLSQSKGNVEICVRDSINTTIPDAVIMFIMTDSLVAAATTNQKGCCSLSLDTGNYVLHITHLGHEEYITKLHLTSAGVNLSVVLTNAAIELDVVTISGKDIYETVLNKNIYNVPASVKKVSADVYDILRHVPSLMVNTIERTIKLALTENYIVTVNNIMRDKMYLTFLNPKEIERIEIIRYPGKRYKDIDAIINIVTNTKPVTGQVFQTEGRLSPISIDNTYLNLGYRHIEEKLSISLYGTGELFNDKKNEYSLIRDIEKEGTITHTEKYSNKGKTVSNKTVSNLATIIDYTASSKTCIMLNMYCNYLNDKKYIPYTGKVSYGSELWDLKSSDDFHKKGGDYGIIVYSQTDFNKDHSMNVEAKYKSGKSNINILLSETAGNNPVSENSQLMKEQWQSVDIQANVIQQLKKIRLEEGYRGYWFDNIIDIETNKIVVNSSKHNDLRNYFYANALSSIDNHTELTPSSMLRYNINNRQNIIFNYRLTRQSPASSLVLNSTPVYEGDDTTQVFLGNPGLKPYYVNSLRLDYEFFTQGKFYTRLSFRHNSSNNAIVQKKYLDNGIYYTTYINATNYSVSSASFNFNFNITKWWRISLNGATNFNTYKNAESVLNKKYTSYSAGFDNSINYKSLSVYFSYFPSIRNSTLTGYLKKAEYSNLSISCRRNSWTFAMMTYCLFSPVREITETYSDGYSQIYSQNDRNRRFRLTLKVSYFFQKGKQQADKQKRSRQYDEVGIN